MKNLLSRFIRDDQGQDLIEYAFLAAFIALAVIVGLNAVAGGVNNSMNTIATSVSGAGGSGGGGS